MPVTEHRKRPRPNLPPVILTPRERELVLYFVRRYVFDSGLDDIIGPAWSAAKD